MIYAIGDSHSAYTFKDVPGVDVRRIGPVTLKRVGYMEDTLVPSVVSLIEPTPEDTLIFCFGEIDMRCYVKPVLELKKDATEDGLLLDWVERYVAVLESLDMNGARIAVMSVVPPATKRLAETLHRHVGGTDEERAGYTRTLNSHLERLCGERGWLYLDVYSLYADSKGMLPAKRIDSHVHIKDTRPVRQLLVKAGLLP